MASKAGTNQGKDVLYVDVDDEITAIIDKVRESHQKIVALVLPKRASVLQSIVNMKLLKRSADEAKKKIVLITAEPGLLPLAGTVGVHVAKTLQTKPEIPDSPGPRSDTSDTIEEAGEVNDDDPAVPVDKSRTVGELAGAAAVESELDDTIQMDDEPEDDGKKPEAAAAAKKSGKDKSKFRIPNFNKFRLWLVLGAVGIIVLLTGLVFALKVMPKATVSIKTDSTAINNTVPLTLKTASDTELDANKGVLAATIQQTQKTQNAQVPATGTQNNGAKATGTVTIKNCTDDPVTIPAGSGLSASGLTFITQETVNLDSGNFSGGGVCKTIGTHIGSTDVMAQSPGAKYNVAAQAYTIAGQSGSVTASGTAMAGGTDDIVKVVTQADIDAAKQKIGGQDTEQLHNDLKSGLITKDLYAIDQTFKANEADTKLSANVGDKIDTVTVTQTTTFTMLGVSRDDLQKIIANAADDKIDTKKQKILEYGIEDAQIEVQSQDGNGAALTITTTVVAGPELDKEAIKKQVAGKKAGDASSILKASPGVTDVTVDYSPFWVSSIPKDVKKITITIEKPTVQKTDDSDNP